MICITYGVSLLISDYLGVSRSNYRSLYQRDSVQHDYIVVRFITFKYLL